MPPVEPGSYLSSKLPLLSLRIRVCHPNTRIYVRLLGPCFKTGRWKPFRQNRECAYGNPHPVPNYRQPQSIAVQTNWPAGAGTEPKRRTIDFLNPTHGMTRGYNRSESSSYLPHGFLPRIELILTHLQLQDPLHLRPRHSRVATDMQTFGSKQLNITASNDWFPVLPS